MIGQKLKRGISSPHSEMNADVRRALHVLNKRDKKVVSVITLTQVLLSLLDLAGVAVIGALGALAVNGVQSRPAGDRVMKVLRLLRIENFSFQGQAVAFGLIAACVLVTKTLLSVYFMRKIMFYMSRKGAEISGNLIGKLLNTNLFVIQGRSTQDALYALNGGVTALTMGFIATAIGMIADLSLLIFLAGGMLVIDPMIAISSVLIFSAIGLLLFFFQQLRAKELGQTYSKLNIQINERTIEALTSYRELLVRGIRGDHAKLISELQMRLARNQAEITFMPLVSKYIVEVSVVCSALIICGTQFALTDASHAVASLSVFLAAGSRIAPAVLRLQQGAISIRGNLASCKPTLDLIESLNSSEPDLMGPLDIDIAPDEFKADIEVEGISVIYPDSNRPALDNCSISIHEGMFVAIVGPSGAGKTTLVDALLGVLPVSNGRISISGKTPLDAIRTWPGKISYVPQDVALSNSTITENIKFGFKTENPEVNILQALDKAQLSSFILSLPSGVETKVGERGSRLSGGQKQRIGIARALYSNPRLLIFDEATSALDSETENLFSNSILELKGKSTIVMIAHRLSTVRLADLVVYVENGKIRATGTMQEVRNQVPNFDQQASLMGI